MDTNHIKNEMIQSLAHTGGLDSGTIDALIQALDLLDILQQQNRVQWIGVIDELPKTVIFPDGHEYSETVFVLTKDRKVVSAIFNGKGFLGDFCFWDADEEVTHWAPIPLPLPEIEDSTLIHAHWVEDGSNIFCSNCGDERNLGDYRPPYCEECGAKMDEKVD